MSAAMPSPLSTSAPITWLLKKLLPSETSGPSDICAIASTLSWVVSSAPVPTLATLKRNAPFICAISKIFNRPSSSKLIRKSSKSSKTGDARLPVLTWYPGASISLFPSSSANANSVGSPSSSSSKPSRSPTPLPSPTLSPSISVLS